MSLIRYRLDYSKLSPDEAEDLIQRIDKISFDGFLPAIRTRIGEFFLDESVDVSILRIPDSCHLTRI